MSINEPAAKRRKTSKQTPTSFVIWNCNGFTSRAKWDAAELQKLLSETDYPDMVCMQEARLKAYDATQRHRPAPAEYAGVQSAVEEIFQDYRPVWSLADNKYAGTLTMIHKRLDDIVQSDRMAFSLESAIELLLKRFCLTRQQVGLCTPSSENVATAISSSPAKKQTTMTAFFSQKKAPKSCETKLPIITTNGKGKHHPEGRIQFFSFPKMDVIQTYVPNNGTKEESFQKRRQWDQQMLQFFKDRTKILQVCNQDQRPMLWCGDLNVAMDYRDGTHFVKKENGSIYEWWTDEEKCFASGLKRQQQQPTTKDPDDTGIPSFTAAERRRIKEIVTRGDFVDVWRARYPKGVAESNLTPWDRPNYTWRGHLSTSGSYAAKYQGKGQRLDYFLLSPSKLLLPTVEYCEILGYGERREGLFCGSDHCASLLRLKEDQETVGS